ncbi:MAG: NYN domain-containing protein [Patescibacteria group bacterium]
MKQERVLLLIDGSNFYFKLKSLDLQDLLYFDFHRFARYLARSSKLIRSCYYVGRIRQDGTKKTRILFDGQQKLIGLLKKCNFHYSLGYLLKNDGVYHEKGVDVQIATDILVAAYEDICDRIILVSSDTDLSPAIKKAQEKEKAVEYIGFSHQPSVAMVSVCKESRLLSREDAEQFIKTDRKG